MGVDKTWQEGVCMRYQVAAPPPPRPEHLDDYFTDFLFLRSILSEDGNRWEGVFTKATPSRETSMAKSIILWPANLPPPQGAGDQ